MTDDAPTRPRRRGRCPRCGSYARVPILHGMVLPGPDGELPDAHLGGCEVCDDPSKWYCNACGHEWGSRSQPALYTVHVRRDWPDWIAFVTRGLPTDSHVATQANTLPALLGHVRDAIAAATGEDDFQVDYVLSQETLKELVEGGPMNQQEAS